MYEEDLVKEGTYPFEINGRKFEYQLTTAGIENDWIPQYMYLGNDGKPVHDFGKLNKLKMLRLTKVPYEPLKMIGVAKEWKDLNDDQKWKLLGLINPTIFNQIIENIARIDKGDTSVKKNS